MLSSIRALLPTHVAFIQVSSLGGTNPSDSQLSALGNGQAMMAQHNRLIHIDIF
jgi:hypothetical protein